MLKKIKGHRTRKGRMRRTNVILVVLALSGSGASSAADPSYVRPERTISEDVLTYDEVPVREQIHDVAAGSSVTMVAWSEEKPDGTSRTLASRLSPSGELLLPHTAIPAHTGGPLKVATNGSTFLLAWPSGAVRVSSAGQVLDDPPIPLTSDSGAVAVASDGEHFLALVGAQPDGVSETHAQRIRADGTLEPSIRVAAGRPINMDIASNGSMYLAVWRTSAGDALANVQGLFAARIDGTGKSLDDGGVLLQPGAEAGHEQSPPNCVWVWPLYPCIYAGQGVRRPANFAHVTSDGERFMVVITNGRSALVDPQTGLMTRKENSLPCIPQDVASTGQGYIVSCWDPSFVVLLADGTVFDHRPAQSIHPNSNPIRLNGGPHGYVASWTSRPAASDSDALASPLSADGGLLDRSGIALAPVGRTHQKPQGQEREYPRVAIGANGALAVWHDRRRQEVYGVDLYARLLNADGSPAGPEILLREDDTSMGPVAYAAGTYLVTWWAGGEWVDDPPELRCRRLVGKRVSTAGTVMDAEPFSIVASGSCSSDDRTVIASDGGKFLLVTSNGTSLRTTIVEPSGAVIPGGVVTTETYNDRGVSVAWGRGLYMVGVSGDWQHQLLRVRPDGSWMSTGSITYSPVEPSAIASDGNIFLVAGRGRDGRLRVARFDAAGRVLDPPGSDGLLGEIDPGGVEVGDWFTWGPAVGWSGANFVVAFTNGPLRTARVSAAGEVLDPGGVVVGQEGTWDFAHLAADTRNGRMALAYSRYEPLVSARSVYMRMISES